ncbi:MAG: dienelactone hydrolase family protein [Xenococcaceae cyanobacterium]
MFSIRKFLIAIALSSLLFILPFPARAELSHSDDYNNLFDGSPFPVPQQVNFTSVTDAEPNGVSIFGFLHRPAGSGPFPAVVVLHGCSGIYSRSNPSRGLSDKHEETAVRLAQSGYVNIHVMSFIGTPREDLDTNDGDRPYRECGGENEVDERTQRAYDAYAALDYLATLDYVDINQVAVMGWSHGGQTVQHVVGPDHAGTSNDFRAAISFYGGCGLFGAYGGTNNSSWRPRIPTLMLHGSEDDLYQDLDCQNRVGAANNDLTFGGYTQIVVYDGADHSFDGDEYEEFEDAWEDYEDALAEGDSDEIADALEDYEETRANFFTKVHADRKLIDVLDVYVSETKTLDEVDLSPEDSLTKITLPVKPILPPEHNENAASVLGAINSPNFILDLDEVLYDPFELYEFDDPQVEDLRMTYSKEAGPDFVSVSGHELISSPNPGDSLPVTVTVKATNWAGSLVQNFVIGNNSVAFGDGFKVHEGQELDVGEGSLRIELDDFVESAIGNIAFTANTDLGSLGLILSDGLVTGNVPSSLPLDLSFQAQVGNTELPFTLHLESQTVDVGFGSQQIVKSSVEANV